MTAFTVSDIRGFMRHLILEETFDRFLLCEAEIRGKADVKIDGRLPETYYSPEELSEKQTEGEFSPYSDLRPLLREAIRGHHTPSFLKVIMKLPESLRREILGEEIPGGFYINILFRNGGISITTGTSGGDFRLDRTPEKKLDSWFREFLGTLHISFEEPS